MATRPLAYNPMLSSILTRDHGIAALPFDQMPLEQNAVDNFIEYTQAVLTSTKIEPPPTYQHTNPPEHSRRLIEQRLGYKERVLGSELTRYDQPYDCRYSDAAIKEHTRKLANTHAKTFMPCTLEQTITQDAPPTNNDRPNKQTIWRVKSKVIPDFEPEGRIHQLRYPSCKADNLRIKMEKRNKDDIKPPTSEGGQGCADIEIDGRETMVGGKKKNIHVKRTLITDFKADKVYALEAFNSTIKRKKLLKTGERNAMSADANSPGHDTQVSASGRQLHVKEGMAQKYVDPGDAHDHEDNQHFNRYQLHQKIKASMQSKMDEEFDKTDGDLEVKASTIRKASEHCSGAQIRDGQPEDTQLLIREGYNKKRKNFDHAHGDSLLSHETEHIEGESAQDAVGREKRFTPLVRRAMFGMKNAIEDIQRYGAPLTTNTRVKRIKQIRESALSERYKTEHKPGSPESDLRFERHFGGISHRTGSKYMDTERLSVSAEKPEERTSRVRLQPKAGAGKRIRKRNESSMGEEFWN